jgi:hypothetical protein
LKAFGAEIAGPAYFQATGQSAAIHIYWVGGNDMGEIAAVIWAAAADGSITRGSDEANRQTASQQLGVDYVGKTGPRVALRDLANGAAEAARPSSA